MSLFKRRERNELLATNSTQAIMVVTEGSTLLQQLHSINLKVEYNTCLPFYSEGGGCFQTGWLWLYCTFHCSNMGAFSIPMFIFILSKHQSSCQSDSNLQKSKFLCEIQSPNPISVDATGQTKCTFRHNEQLKFNPTNMLLTTVPVSCTPWYTSRQVLLHSCSLLLLAASYWAVKCGSISRFSIHY